MSRILLLWAPWLLFYTVRVSSATNSYSSSGNQNQYGSGYDDNFDAMYSGMEPNQGYSKKIKMSIPNPPKPPGAPRPMKAPNTEGFENDRNKVPAMPGPIAPPAGFSPMDIDIRFPSYEPNVDDTFYDSDGGSGGYAGNNYGSNNNANNAGWASSVHNNYQVSSTSRYVSPANSTAYPAAPVYSSNSASQYVSPANSTTYSAAPVYSSNSASQYVSPANSPAYSAAPVYNSTSASQYVYNG